VVPDCRSEGYERAIVHERSLDRDVAERGSPKLVSVGGIPGEVLAAEVFVGSRPVENIIGVSRNELGDSDCMLAKVCEHFARSGGCGMALHTTGFANKQQRAALLSFVQSRDVATRVMVDRRVRECERELELRDGPRKQVLLQRTGAGRLNG
jgi:hypothetical protein